MERGEILICGEGEEKSTHSLRVDIGHLGDMGGGRVFEALVKSTYQILATYLTFNMLKNYVCGVVVVGGGGGGVERHFRVPLWPRLGQKTGVSTQAEQ